MSRTIDLTNAKPCPDCRRMLTTEPKCFYCAERDALRAELAKEKANASLVRTWEQAARKAAGEDGVQFVGPNTIFAVSDKLRAELAAAKNLLARIHRDGGHHTEAVGFAQSVADADAKVSEWLLAAEERTALAAHVERLEKALDPIARAYRVSMEPFAPGIDEADGAHHWMPHGWPSVADFKDANTALAATPAQSLEAVTAPLKAHVERLVGALECVPVDLIHAIENGDTGANVFLSAGSCKLIGDALAATPAQSLEAVTAPLKAHVEQLEKGLRVARELTREEPDIYVVGIRRVIDELIAATPAQSLAAHDAALLREVAEKWEKLGDDCLKRASVNLRAAADRIAKEAANGEA